MLDGALLVWFLLAAASLLFVIWDSLTNAPTSWVQRIAWILVVVYTGVVGLVLYLLACRRPFPGGHDAFTRATWKQALNSEMHCLAGDATGIVLAASIVSAFDMTNGWDATIEYLAGFVVGLFVFQALMMRGMYDGDYGKAVRKTFFAETVSMNMVMAGMIPTMIVLASMWPESERPTELAFWFRMGLASLAGGLLAYPINYWLVKNHLKHGCMTLPGRDGPAPQLGHAPMEAGAHAPGTQAPGTHASPEEMGTAHAAKPAAEGHAASPAEGRAAPPEAGMAMGTLPLAQAVGWILATCVVLVAAVAVTGHFVPVVF